MLGRQIVVEVRDQHREIIGFGSGWPHVLIHIQGEKSQVSRFWRSIWLEGFKDLRYHDRRGLGRRWRASDSTVWRSSSLGVCCTTAGSSRPRTGISLCDWTNEIGRASCRERV